MTLARSQWLIRAAVLLLAAGVLAIVLIASGVFDPTPVGPLKWELPGEQIGVAAQSRHITWLAEAVPNSAFTVRLSGALTSGELDSGYGLVLGQEEDYLAVAVSPLGYLAIWESKPQMETNQDSYLLQWQTWPHVKMGQAENELWIDITGNRAAVRINREWLWEGEIEDKARHVGLLGESFGDAAVIDFMNVSLFAGDNE